VRDPFFEHSRGVLYCGDALDTLKELPEASVNCCVTSPPYWGLRDYGTARWEGGSADCDHVYNTQGKTGDRADRTLTGQAVYKDECGKCGARRLDRQLGLEKTPEEYIARMVEVFKEVRRVLGEDGTLWLNIGDSYASHGGDHGGREDNQVGVGARRAHQAGAGDHQSRKPSIGLKPKDMVGIPWMLAFALRADGWYLRSEIIWAKPNPMPESVTDRPTKAHEQIFLLAKSQKYFYNAEVIKEPSTAQEFRRPHGWANSGDHTALDWSTKRERPSALRGSFNGKTEAMAKDGRNAFRAVVDNRNKRSVWTVTTEPFPEAHFATFPQALIQPCVLAGCPEGGIVLDPFSGAGTTALVAKENARRFIGIELSADYCEIAAQRLSQEVFSFEDRQRSTEIPPANAGGNK
jgi:DNA modification methylase